MATQSSASDASIGARARPRWQAFALWAAQIFAAMVFAAAAVGKFAGAERMVQVFADIGIGQWFRYLTAVLEIAGAALILAPRTAALGGALLACIMVGAVVAHLFVIGGSPVPAIVLLIVTAAVAAFRRGEQA